MDLDIKIDDSICKKCKVCVQVCPTHISLDKRACSGFHNSDCSRCFHCYAVCPSGAIRIAGNTYSEPEDTNGRYQIQESQLLSLLANRRSYRRFKDNQVGKEIIEKLISAAGLIPSGGNSHQYDFTVIPKGEKRDYLIKKLRKSYELKRKILKNSLLRRLLYIFSDSQTRGFLKDKVYLKRIIGLLSQLQNGEDMLFYNAPVVILIHSNKTMPTPKEDCIIAAYHIVLMAESMGLGTCIITLAQKGINENKQCKRIVGLNLLDRIHAVVVLGYPENRFLRTIPKNTKSIYWT